MYRTLSSTALLAAAVVALGCKPARDANVPSTGAVGTTTDTTPVTPPAPAETGAAGAAAPGALTDANIVALLDEANAADSAAGAFAKSRATDPEVKAFAQLMITEHHMLRTKGQELAKKLNITPEPPANDPVQIAAKAEMDALKAAAKGPAFDRAYIDQEVAIHRAVIDLAQQAHDATRNAELKTLIETAKPSLERHLDRAETIQKRLGKATA